MKPVKKPTLCIYPAECRYCTKHLCCKYDNRCGYKVRTALQLASWAVLLLTIHIYNTLLKLRRLL